MKDKIKFALIVVLVVLVLVFVSEIIVYNAFIKPKLQKQLLDSQIEIKEKILTTIINEIYGRGYVNITDGNRNSIILIPYVGDAFS